MLDGEPGPKGNEASDEMLEVAVALLPDEIWDSFPAGLTPYDVCAELYRAMETVRVGQNQSGTIAATPMHWIRLRDAK